MLLSKKSLPEINEHYVVKPPTAIFDLPVKVIQFGTGVLLRGLPDYLIDKANRNGIFNGRILVVKSTEAGDIKPFDTQDNLYTLFSRGIEKGEKKEENVICSAISTVLSANQDWQKILKYAVSADLKVVISNTTEVGIQLVEESIHLSPPSSFPAKLLAILYQRYKHFKGAYHSGLVIIPTELLPDNGRILKEIIMQLADINQLETGFGKWVNEANFFCNSLVDRIVTGQPPIQERAAFEKAAGYKDTLSVMTEPYYLWAIEGNDTVKNILSFEQADSQVIVSPDINNFRELKLRILNGTHTLSCAMAILMGIDTVSNAMGNEQFLTFIRRLMAEICVAIPGDIAVNEAIDFSEKVLDRFRNPYIEHLWINISQQYTTKLRMRVAPLVIEYYKRFNKVPQQMAAGFAAYLVFIQGQQNGDHFYGEYNGIKYTINDDKAKYFSSIWPIETPDKLHMVLSDTSLWGTDLAILPGFSQAVQYYMGEIVNRNIKTILAG